MDGDGAAVKILDVSAADVEIRPVEWEWSGRIPKGKLTICDGDPGEGKSVVTVDIAARKSTGRAFPDGASCEAGNVLMVNVEDGVEDTIVPRLKAHGADLSRIFIFSGVPDGRGGTRLLELPRDIALLTCKVIERDAKLLIIDPVMTMLGGDSNKDQDARKALAPLRDMAEGTGVAVIAVRHLNKSVGLKAIQRGGGNMGLIGVARAGLFFVPHPEDDSLKVMAAHKSNLSQRPQSLSYRIATSAVHDTARVEWMGVTEHDADSLAASGAGATTHEKSELEEAREFLHVELEHGPIWAKQIFKDAEGAGIARKTLYRAKDSMRVKSEKVGEGGWRWVLPVEDGKMGGRDYVGHVGHVHKDDAGRIANSPYVKEGDQNGQGGQDGQPEPNGHLDGHLRKRPPRSGPESEQDISIEGDVVEEQLDTPSPRRVGLDAEQGQPENDASRHFAEPGLDTLRDEREVFDLFATMKRGAREAGDEQA